MRAPSFVAEPISVSSPHVMAVLSSCHHRIKRAARYHDPSFAMTIPIKVHRPFEPASVVKMIPFDDHYSYPVCKGDVSFGTIITLLPDTPFLPGNFCVLLGVSNNEILQPEGYFPLDASLEQQLHSRGRRDLVAQMFSYTKTVASI